MLPRSILTLFFAAILASAACSRSTESSSGGSGQGDVSEPVVIGEVNGKPLYKPFYTQNLDYIEERLSRDAASADIERYMNAKFEAFDMLVQDALLFEEAQRRGITVSDAEVNAEFARNVKAVGGEARFLAGLKAQGLARRHAVDGMRRKLTVNRLISEDIGRSLTVTDAEAVSWYNEHLDRFTPERWVKASHIFIACPRDADEARVARARDHAMKILASIRGGRASFEEMAREHSEDSTADTDGSLGRIKKGYAPPEFDAVAFSMPPETVSDPVRTDMGFHIIKVGEQTGGKPSPFEEVAESCRKAVLTRKQAAAVKELTDRLRENAKIVSNVQ
ncbi:MAG: peptidylprolyl isomerase [Candidatus Polarisedimenticolia bacterium]